MNTNHNMIRLADGQAVHAPTVIIHSSSNTLVALQMLGPEQSVKANWAKLVSGGRSYHRIQGNSIHMDGSKKHITLKKLLPCGWLEMWIIHNQASYQTLTPSSPRAYFIKPTEETAVLPTFFLYLNRIVATPLLPHWSDYLWQAGKAGNMITPLYPIDCVGRSCYTINTKESGWAMLVNQGLRNGKISF